MIRALDKQKFAEQQFQFPTFAVKWFDFSALHQLTNKLIAKFELIDRGTVGHYTAIEVTIANRLTGTLDVKTFRFDDYLPFDMKGRTDAREDYDGGFYIWSESRSHAPRWYIATPKTTANLTSAIEEYLLQWTDGGLADPS